MPGVVMEKLSSKEEKEALIQVVIKPVEEQLIHYFPETLHSPFLGRENASIVYFHKIHLFSLGLFNSPV
jgi:hypothetical protein